jgi:predicted 3-demethylubiquinone-9 3-methyltransferase (glyoxalase superfamily)
MPQIQKIATHLWFDDKAEEAANFYMSLFEDSKMGPVLRNGDNGPGPKGSVLALSFYLAGQEFKALNGGPHFKFNEAISLFVHCETQPEVDRLWNALIADGGAPSQCGWLKDRYGLSWQIVPNGMMDLLSDPDSAKANRAMAAMMKMSKLDIAQVKAAHAG